MTSRDFAFWLQGFLEIAQVADGTIPELNMHQVNIIQQHLSLVFKHEIDPSFEDSAELDKIHNAQPPWKSSSWEQEPKVRC